MIIMGINYNSDKRIFHIQGKDVSYVIKANEYNDLIHLYYGKKIRHINDEAINTTKARTWSVIPTGSKDKYGIDSALLEYPTFGHTDFRNPALHIEQESGSTVVELKYHGYEIFKGKKGLEGLPATYGNEEEAETLEITLRDEVIDIYVVLSYTVLTGTNIITRSSKIINKGKETLKILSAQSCCVDFKESDYEMLQLSGAWARERNMMKRKLVQGVQSIGSVRGTSSHVHNPFLALLSPDSTENQGEVYGFNFVYSGNFIGEVSVCEHNRTRVLMGIHPMNFSWELREQDSFQTPEVVMAYSHEGLNGMSQEYHGVYKENLVRGTWKHKERPILINSWEATYFDFTRESIEGLARKASEAGIELCVLDDGWFGKRNDDKTSLGDWYVNKTKLDGSVETLAKNVEAMDMSFGLWFEPEMISPDSDLYREHSDWCIHVPNRSRIETRNQLVLDFARQEVCDYIIDVVSKVLSSAPISYVKWDMNRYLTDVMSMSLPAHRQMETSHRYCLGLYYVMEELVTRHKDVLFEGCSGGGGRFDPGILYYMPQIWASDDTDAIERLKIQYATSIVYPINTMGSHVSSVPNHIVERSTPLETRGNVAMSGNLGYELDITNYNEEEMNELKEQINFYKANRQLIQFGDFFRINNPFTDNRASWVFVSKDQTEAVLFNIAILGMPNPHDQQMKFVGLNPEFDYEIEGVEGIFGGDELMNLGLTLPVLKDYQSVRYKLRKI